MTHERAEQVFVSHISEINRIVAFVARQHHLSADEAEEFGGKVHLRLIEKDYDIIRKWKEQSSLGTYLTVVINRHFLDYRISLWGKWRPSAEARRLGPVAMRLEMLTGRDNLSFEEASQTLRLNHGVQEDDETLRQLHARLPVRTRRRFVDIDGLEALPDQANGPEDDALDAERAERARRAHLALRRAMSTLPPDEHLLVSLHYFERVTVAEIARKRETDQRQLYQRLSGILLQLRKQLLAAGISADDVRDCFGSSSPPLPPPAWRAGDDRGNLDTGSVQ